MQHDETDGYAAQWDQMAHRAGNLAATQHDTYTEDSMRPAPTTEMILPAPVARTYPIRSYQLQLVDPDGWPATHTYNDLTMDQFEQIKLKLRQRGYTPVARAASSAPAAPAATSAPSVPVCPVHGEPMKEMAKPDKKTGATHWCTKKTDDGFCKERGTAA